MEGHLVFVHGANPRPCGCLLGQTIRLVEEAIRFVLVGGEVPHRDYLAPLEAVEEDPGHVDARGPSRAPTAMAVDHMSIVRGQDG